MSRSWSHDFDGCAEPRLVKHEEAFARASGDWMSVDSLEGQC